MADKENGIEADDVIGDPEAWCHCDCDQGKEIVRLLAPLVLEMEETAEGIEKEYGFHSEIVQLLADALRAMLICQITTSAPITIGVLTTLKETIMSMLRRYEIGSGGGSVIGGRMPMTLKGGDLQDLMEMLRDGGEDIPAFIASKMKKRDTQH